MLKFIKKLIAFSRLFQHPKYFSRLFKALDFFLAFSRLFKEFKTAYKPYTSQEGIELEVIFRAGNEQICIAKCESLLG